LQISNLIIKITTKEESHSIKMVVEVVEYKISQILNHKTMEIKMVIILIKKMVVVVVNYKKLNQIKYHKFKSNNKNHQLVKITMQKINNHKLKK
jgi:hypothetical protein